MPDHARSDDAAVQAQLDRFAQLSPGRDTLGLERIAGLLERLGNPHFALPPVFHVAGTNGKGSTCAFLRAALEAAGHKVHVYTSPHLCRFNERVRVAGKLIEDAVLAPLLKDVLDATGDIGPSFFEATTAAAFLAFARTPADAAVIEVGLGGRLDASNVITKPAVCGIAQLGVDHQAFLGDDAITIAGEKAGIAKHDVPLITMAYSKSLAARIEQVARVAGAHWLPKGSSWDAAAYQNRLHYKDLSGKLDLPLPRLSGAHQAMNAALAVAMIRAQTAVTVPEAALKAAMGWADWPARMQRLGQGPLSAILPRGAELWLDGCHNPAAADLIAAHMRETAKPGQALHIICGILANKDAPGILALFKGLATALHPVPVPDHPCHDPAALAAWAREHGMASFPAGTITESLTSIARQTRASAPPKVLIMGSLYLAGDVLRDNGQLPD
jgi:dihydrofolate synthase / folylpolyglutamate synthase